MNYKNFLQTKVDLARAQMKAGNNIPNERMSAEFSALRARLLAGRNSPPTTAITPEDFKKLRDRVKKIWGTTD